jgi:hypothetical protein
LFFSNESGKRSSQCKAGSGRSRVIGVIAFPNDRRETMADPASR